LKDSITIISSSRMGPGTFEAKFIPLSKVQQVEKIIVARKERGPEIDKVSYQVLPRLCKNPILNLLITPFILAKLVKKHKAKLLLAYHYIPHFYLVYIAAKFTATPYILGQTGTDVHRLAALPFRGWFIRRIIKNAMFFNVPGSKSKARWNELGFDNVHILHSTIDTERFIPSTSDTKEFDFIYIGRLEVYKGLPRIFNTMEELVKIYPNVKMAVVGYGSLEEELKTEVKKRGLDGNISFHGFQKDTRAWLHKARIFVMASDNEGLPCALMEAMSCGMVCISSLVGNIPDIIVKGKTGFGFTLAEVNSLKDLMQDAYENEANLETMKKAARAMIEEHHSHTSAIKLWENELSGVIKQ